MAQVLVPVRVGSCLPAAPHFLVEAKVGEGRYSEVYQVRDLRTGRLYAAKLYASQNAKITPATLERFEREIFIGVGLNHPAVMRLMSVVHVGHVPIPIYEYAAAGNLYEFVVEFKQIIALETALLWMGQMAEGVAYLHGKGLIHRDITPKNVLIREDGTVFLGDFGMALDRKAKVEPERYATNIAPLHVSSNQHLNPNEVTAVDDIFSLGQCFFFMLTRRLPVGGYTDIRRHHPDCPEDLSELVNAMRHPDERHRPKSAVEVMCQCRALLKRRNLNAA